MSVRLEFVSGSSRKFWECKVNSPGNGTVSIVSYGKIGGASKQLKTKHASNPLAREFCQKASAAKIKKGYVKVKSAKSKPGKNCLPGKGSGAGLLYGAMMPYWFSAMTMKSVGEAANDMVKECISQFPKILSGEMKPDYKRCISISTDASLREMIAPGALVILSPLIGGIAFGKNCTAGMLSGALVSGVQLAISMSNTGGAWDNAKKYIESGALGKEHGKGSETHKNAVTGDTVGDPLKDTSGPSLNIVIKLSAIISLVFGSVIADYSDAKTGGPFWLAAKKAVVSHHGKEDM